MIIHSFLILSHILFSFAQQEPVDPGITLIDSITFPCTKILLEKKKCEAYLAYDIRDDIIYVVRKKDRKTDKTILSLTNDREYLAHQSLRAIDLVKEFPGKNNPVERYSGGFKMVDGQLKVRITLHFENEIASEERLVDVDLYKKGE